MSARGNKGEGSGTKQCPFCSAELPLNCRRCLDCGKRVGAVDRNGRAKKPVDWYAYTACILSWLVFIFYLWWAFFRK